MRAVAAVLAASLPLLGIAWTFNLPGLLGQVYITEQYLAVILGLTVLAGLVLKRQPPVPTVVDVGFGLLSLAGWWWLALNYQDWLLDPVNRGPEKWVPAVAGILGLFEATRKRPLPLLPRQIGVVTSLHGAALQDILKVLARRHPTAHVVIRPVRVQGEGAAGQIARGIDQLSRQEGVDVIIVGRGGGSLEDLWAFNEEPVARAIATATVPVISAVGHEIDVTISDLVADIRAATPSAAAEIVVAGLDELLGRVDQLSDRLRATLRDTVRRLLTSVLELDRRPGVAGWPARLAIRGRHAAELTHALTQATRSTLVTRERRLRSAQLKLEAHEPGRRVEASRTRLVVAGERLGAAIVHRRQRLEGRLGDLTGRLEALSPLGVLARGYAVCWNANRTAIVRDASAVSVGDDVAITLRQGQLTCTVTAKD